MANVNDVYCFKQVSFCIFVYPTVELILVPYL